MKNRFPALMVLIALILSGCASALSKEALMGADRTLTVDATQSSPDKHSGKKVVWGGVILSSENLENTTEIEVLETPLSYDDAPAEAEVKVSRGRVIIEAPGYLDTAIYKIEARITVSGVIKGIVKKKLGRMEYGFPVITPVELKLFPVPPKVVYYYGYPYPARPYPYQYPYGTE
ncbi:MAG: Slp family lipoprotein [Deltaproteobacteria bacterium]